MAISKAKRAEAAKKAARTRKRNAAKKAAEALKAAAGCTVDSDMGDAYPWVPDRISARNEDAVHSVDCPSAGTA